MKIPEELNDSLDTILVFISVFLAVYKLVGVWIDLFKRARANRSLAEKHKHA